MVRLDNKHSGKGLCCHLTQVILKLDPWWRSTRVLLYPDPSQSIVQRRFRYQLALQWLSQLFIYWGLQLRPRQAISASPDCRQAWISEQQRCTCCIHHELEITAVPWRGASALHGQEALQLQGTV